MSRSFCCGCRAVAFSGWKTKRRQAAALQRSPRRPKNIRVNSCPLVVSSAWMKDGADFQIRPARVEDVPVILQLIRDLATYERAPNEVTATKEQLVDALFGERPSAEVLLAFEG